MYKILACICLFINTIVLCEDSYIEMISKYINESVEEFKELKAQGKIDIKLVKSDTFKIMSNASPDELQNLVISNNNSTLNITMNNLLFGNESISLTIYAPMIDSIKLHNDANISTDYFYARKIETHDSKVFMNNLDGLQLVDSYNSEVNLTLLKKPISSSNFAKMYNEYQSFKMRLDEDGAKKLKTKGKTFKLNTYGNSTVVINNIYDMFINIRGYGDSSIILNGTCSLMDIYLTDDAQLKGKKLLANVGFINTKDKSYAEISILDWQSSYASNYSKIYAYHNPKFSIDYVSGEASVINMFLWGNL